MGVTAILAVPQPAEISYTYDVYNQLIARTVDQDGAGGAAAVTTEFVYADGQVVLELVDGVLDKRNLWGPQVDQLLAIEDAASNDVFWTLTDQQNTLRDIAEHTAGTTTVTGHRSYDAFGNITAETGSLAGITWGYTGKYRDAATGLQVNLHRWYDAPNAVWLSADPIEDDRENTYRYVGNDPLNRVDPSGLRDLIDAFGRVPARSDGYVDHNALAPETLPPIERRQWIRRKEAGLSTETLDNLASEIRKTLQPAPIDYNSNERWQNASEAYGKPLPQAKPAK